MLLLPKIIIDHIIDYLPYKQQANVDLSRIPNIRKKVGYKILKWWRIKNANMCMAYEYMEPINLVRSYIILKFPKNQRLSFIIKAYSFAESYKQQQTIVQLMHSDDDYNKIFKIIVNNMNINQLTKILYEYQFY